jgi:TPR repeat protein
MAAGTAGCAGGSYAGIPLAADAADPELQQLARRAQTGDKQAQLELGIRYEEGRGVLRDLDRAERLYRGAAAASGGRTWVYSPSVRKGGSGRAIPVDRGPRQPGLAEAARRLAALRNGRARP